MIDIFYRVRGTTQPDAERAQDLIETLKAALPAEGETGAVGGRPSRRRGTVAQLLARRDKVPVAALPKVRLVARRDSV